MEKYIGVKLVAMRAMTRGQYNQYRGWEIPEGEDPVDDGYLVEYLDSPNSNHPDHENYISWSPKNVADNAYRRTDRMMFGLAIEAAKKGLKIAFRDWYAKDQFVVMQPTLDLPPFNTQGTARKVNDRTAKFSGEDVPLHCPPYFAMHAGNGDWICGWLPSQVEMITDGWYIVD